MSPTRMRGLSDANGSWKMIWMSRRASRSASPCELEQVAPVQQRLAVRSAPCRAAAARSPCRSVVLPQPDSPTSASVRPAVDLKADVATASKPPRTRCSRPLRIGKRTRRCCTSSSGAPASGPRRPACRSRPGERCAGALPTRRSSYSTQRTRWPWRSRKAGACAPRQAVVNPGAAGAKRQPVKACAQRRHGAGDRRQRRPRRLASGSARSSACA